MPAGRPTDLTPEVMEDVRRFLPIALYIETVADYIGVSRISVGNWIRRGKKESKRLNRNKRARAKKSEALYLQFFITVKKALAEGEYQDADTIKKASGEQWTAAAWRLERRFPERWSNYRGEVQQLARTCQELRDELARLRAEVGPTNPTSSGRAEGQAPPATPRPGDAAGD